MSHQLSGRKGSHRTKLDCKEQTRLLARVVQLVEGRDRNAAHMHLLHLQIMSLVLRT